MVKYMYNCIYREKEFYNLAEPILRNAEFQRRRTFLHHQDSVYDHSLRVAWVAYKIAKSISRYKKINIRNVVVGALLHDFYLVPWREDKNSIIWKKHGFTHGKTASINSYQFFPSLMNTRIENAIRRHMFPLTIIPPRYIEGWIITTADKCVSLEIFKKPKELPRYIGINLSKDNIIQTWKTVYRRTELFVSRMV